jgi:hypothetical protein
VQTGNTTVYTPKSHATPAEPRRAAAEPPRYRPLQNLQAVNGAREHLLGINSQPLPEGKVTLGTHQQTIVKASGGRTFELRSSGTLRSLTVGEARETLRHNGRVATFHNGTLDAIRGVHGGLTVAMNGPHNTLIVSQGGHRGYVQRPVNLMGQSYVKRTYVQGKTRTVRLYRTYTYRGVPLNYYIPATYYPVAYYRWAYKPWPAPVLYVWQLTSAAWYAFYASYFQQAPAYTGPAAWLTDYALSDTLADAYGAQQDVPLPHERIDDSLPPADDELEAQVDTPISADVKQQLTQAADQELIDDSNVASDPAKADDYDELSKVLQPNHTFVADTDLDVTTPDQAHCYVSAGNVLRLTPESAAAPGTTVEMVVVTSRRGDCPADTHVLVPLDKLQEMENAFRARLSEGLAVLRQKQGQDGIPAAPAEALAAPRAEAYPSADTDNLDGMLASALQRETQAEAQTTSRAFAEGAGG